MGRRLTPSPAGGASSTDPPHAAAPPDSQGSEPDRCVEPQTPPRSRRTPSGTAPYGEPRCTPPSATGSRPATPAPTPPCTPCTTNPGRSSPADSAETPTPASTHGNERNGARRPSPTPPTNHRRRLPAIGSFHSEAGITRGGADSAIAPATAPTRVDQPPTTLRALSFPIFFAGRRGVLRCSRHRGGVSPPSRVAVAHRFRLARAYESGYPTSKSDVGPQTRMVTQYGYERCKRKRLIAKSDRPRAPSTSRRRIRPFRL